MSNIKITIRVSSIRQFENNLDKCTEKVKSTGENVVQGFLEEAFAMSQERAPVDTGALRDSGKMEVQVTDDAIFGAIGYGDKANVNIDSGISTDLYAVDRHESLTIKNPQAYKWLERLMLGRVKDFEDALENAFQGLF